MTRSVGTRLRGDDRGAVLPIVALSLVVLMVMTAFSVDIGRQLMRRREAQGAADVISLDLARLIDGRTRADLEADPKWDQTRRDAAARNNFPEAGVTAVLGHWDKASQTFSPAALTDIPDAVQVTARDTVNFFFGRVIGIDQAGVTRSAVATPGARALGKLGSVAAGFRYYNEPGFSAEYNVAAQLRASVLNATLYTAFGINGAAGTSAPPTGLNLDVASYKGIANAFITLGDLATELGFGSVDQMLAATITANDLLQAEARVLKNSSDAGAINAGNKIASFAAGASSTLTVQLGKLFYIEQGSGDRAASAEINALDLITNSSQIINGQNFFSTTINTSIPGAPTLPIRVAIIETPQLGWNAEGNGPCPMPDYHGPGCGPHTAQVRIATTIPTTLDLTPYGIPLVQATTVPVVFEAASAYSMFSGIHCTQPTSNSSTDFRVITNGVAMHIGSVTDAALQSTTTLSVQAQALLHGSVTIGLASVDLDAATNVSESKTFKNSAIYSGDVYSNAGILGADETHTFVGDRVANITPESWRYDGGVGNTSISTTMFNNLGISDPVLDAAVAGALNTSLANLDQLLMDPLLSSFGMTIAGADGSILRVDCSDVKVVK